MEIEKYLKDLGSRNNGDVYLGVVGPVRVGKSTFIRRFMEVCVLEHIVDENEKRRTIDELPTTGDGKTITTVEPKFVPSNAVSLSLDEMKVNVRLVDCVGYIIESSTGYLEDGKISKCLEKNNKTQEEYYRDIIAITTKMDLAHV